MKATLSVLGLYHWDNTLFDLMTLPQGMNKDTVIDFILSECSDMEVLYPNPEVLKNLIGVWSHTEQYTWDKLYKTLLFEYNPIDNYDRTETRNLESSARGTSADSGTDTRTSADSGTDTVTSTDSGTDTATSTDSGSETKTSTDSGSDTATSTDSGTDSTQAGSTDTKQVKSFNTADGVWTDKEKDTVSNSGSTTYGKTNTNTAQYGKVNTEVDQFGKVNTETLQHGKVNTEVSQHGKTNTETTNYGKENENTLNKTDVETIRARGNIGTVTTQAMIREERDVALFNIYQVILDSFKQRFCLLVY